MDTSYCCTNAVYQSAQLYKTVYSLRVNKLNAMDAEACRSEVSAVLVSSPTVMVVATSALPLQQFMNLRVAVTGRGGNGVHSVDGGVASLEIVAGDVVLRQAVK